MNGNSFIKLERVSSKDEWEKFTITLLFNNDAALIIFHANTTVNKMWHNILLNILDIQHA